LGVGDVPFLRRMDQALLGFFQSGNISKPHVFSSWSKRSKVSKKGKLYELAGR
jgi:hypothetical protein